MLSRASIRRWVYNGPMAKKKSRKPRQLDPNVAAKSMIDEIARRSEGRPEPEPEKPKNKAAQELAKLGASKGGKARATKLSKKRRSEIAKKAAEARWQNKQ